MTDKNNIYYLMMRDEISTINEEYIREFGYKLLDIIPDYFFSVPASSSGKYHPINDLGEGGLVRHSITVKKMLEHILVPGFFPVTDKEKDLLLLSALFHDSFKSGTQDDFNENKHTRLIHPVLASTYISLASVQFGFPYEDARLMADAIITHMGQWNTSSYEEGVLPLPTTPAQKALHLADYLASRKDINMSCWYDKKEEPVE